MKAKNHLSVFAELLFLCFVFIRIGYVQQDAFYLQQELQFFDFSGSHFLSYVKEPGFLVAYMSRLSTQFFFYPFLGAFLFVSLLWGFQYLLARVSRLRQSFFPLTCVPAAIIVAAGCSAGHAVWVLPESGILYLYYWGAVAICLFFLICRSLPRPWLLFPVLFIGYMFVGVYAFAGGFLYVIYYFKSEKRNSVKYLYCSFFLIWMLLIPFICYHLIYTSVPVGEMWQAGLPVFSRQGETILSPVFLYGLLVSILLLFISPYYSPWYQKTVSFKFQCVGTVVLAGGVLFFLVFNTDPVFNYEAGLYRAMQENNWKQVAALVEGNNRQTSFSIMSYRLGCFKQGNAGRYMFKEPFEPEPDNRNFIPGLYQTGGNIFYYHYGVINYAYRWGMESMVKYGVRIADLRMMAKCALLMGENELAEKYLLKIRSSCFHRDWADQYLLYATGKKQTAGADEFKLLFPLLEGENILDGDDGNIEAYLYHTLSFLEGQGRMNCELSLIANMLRKDLGSILLLYERYITDLNTIPVHYQEAAVIAAYLSKTSLAGAERIDTQVRQRFAKLVELLGQRGRMSKEDLQEAVKSHFGDTYWYYLLYHETGKMGNTSPETIY